MRKTSFVLVRVNRLSRTAIRRMSGITHRKSRLIEAGGYSRHWVFSVSGRASF